MFANLTCADYILPWPSRPGLALQTYPELPSEAWFTVARSFLVCKAYTVPLDMGLGMEPKGEWDPLGSYAPVFKQLPKACSFLNQRATWGLHFNFNTCYFTVKKIFFSWWFKKVNDWGSNLGFQGVPNSLDDCLTLFSHSLKQFDNCLTLKWD